MFGQGVKSKDNDRRSYLQQLVTEFQDTNSQECREQVLANLSNFAYDSANNDFLRQLNVLHLFLDQLSDTNNKIVEFAVGGLCNAVLDPRNKELILKRKCIPDIISCLSSTNEETVLSALTTLMFLISPESKREIITLPVVECMLRFSESPNKRLSNLARIFLHDFCTEAQISDAKNVAHLSLV